MIKPTRSFFSRLLTFLLFFFAFVFVVRGIAPLINNALYSHHKIFIAWLLIDDQSDNQWIFPIACWVIASGLLILGIMRYRKKAKARNLALDQSESLEKTKTRSSIVRQLLFACGILAYLVVIGFLCLDAFGSEVFNVDGTVYEDRLSHQGHVYLLSVAPDQVTTDGHFKFEISQCDASGWFCHVMYDASRKVSLKLDPYVNMPFMYAEVVDAHLQADAAHHQLQITYTGRGSSESGKLFYAIP